MRKFLKYAVPLLFLVLVCTFIIPSTLAIYRETKEKTLKISIKHPTYIIKYNANGGSGTMDDQEFKYDVEQSLSANTFTKTGYVFKKWNTNADGTGTSYINEQVISKLSNVDGTIINLYAQWVDENKVAEVNGVAYDTLQEAINSVTTSDLTTVILLKDTAVNVKISTSQNITLDIGNYTISNSKNDKPAIENSGKLSIINGTITSNATKAGTLNNVDGGVLSISGGKIVNTGDRQAVYNDRGSSATISGNAYLLSTGNARAALQNQGNSDVLITGGTIISTGDNSAIQNSASLTIGIKDDIYDENMVTIRGTVNGVNSSTDFNYYDGIIEGMTNAINNDTKAVNRENDYHVVHTTTMIGEKMYDKAYLANAYVVTFNPNGGNLENKIKNIHADTAIGVLPIPYKPDYTFDGWYTLSTGGDKIDENTIISSDITFYAHWIVNTNDVARINDRNYNTLQQAVSACPSNVECNITLLKDIQTTVTVSASKNIVIDLNSHSINSLSGNLAVFENSGTLTIENGTLNSNNLASTINNNDGYLKLNNVTINSTGERQALYIIKGTAEVSGDSHLSSATTGSYTRDDSTFERATVQVLTNGAFIVKGGTIECSKQHAIGNQGILTIGEQDGNISATSPVIIGNIYGVKNDGTFNLYDGIIKGINNSIDGNITERQMPSNVIMSTQQIDVNTYKTLYLESGE